MGSVITGIALRPQFVYFHRFFQLSREGMVVSRRNAVSLAFAHAIPQLVRFGRILCRQTGLIHIEIRVAQPGIRQSKFRIEFNRALKEWDRFRIAFSAPRSATHAVGLQGFERRSGRFYGHIEFLYRRQRFAQLTAKFLGRLSQTPSGRPACRSLHLVR